jgi:3-hydroxyisobutyrate dehydrogenase-like beta-hydroxyacid dehydrogenase
MSGFTSYALLGLGNLGAPIATEALALGYKLRILTRDVSVASPVRLGQR